mgnify:CR=1 FL=1
MRKLCPKCNLRPVAINYHRDDVTHYRSKCDSCLRVEKRLGPKSPGWVKSGYKKKPHCEKCGFKAKLTEQLGVFYVDGNLKNNNWVNLKTICLNCAQEVIKSRSSWRQSSLLADN